MNSFPIDYENFRTIFKDCLDPDGFNNWEKIINKINNQIPKSFKMSTVECSFNNDDLATLKDIYTKIAAALITANTPQDKISQLLNTNNALFNIVYFNEVANSKIEKANILEHFFNIFNNVNNIIIPNIGDLTKIILNAYYQSQHQTKNKLIYYSDQNIIDMSTIKNVIPKTSLFEQEEILKMVNKNLQPEEITNKEDMKIIKLFISNLIYPIVEDFQLIHVTGEKFSSKNVLEESMDKLQQAKNRNPDVFDHQKPDCVGLDYSKIFNAIFTKTGINSRYMELMSSYASFNSIDDKPYFYFFNHLPNMKNKISMIPGIIQALRFTTFKLNSNEHIQTRIINPENSVYIVGFSLFHPRKTNIKVKDLKEINYPEFLQQVINRMCNRPFEDCYFFFEANKDPKTIILKMYSDIKEKIYDNIDEIINLNMNSIDDIIPQLTEQSINIDFVLNKIIRNIPKKCRRTNNIQCIPNLINITELSQKFYGADKSSIKLKKIPLSQKKKSIVIKTDDNQSFENNFKNESNKNVICQHYVTLEDINKEQLNLKHGKTNNYDPLLNSFLSKYITLNKFGEYVCKSCYEKIDIEQYVQSGTFDDNNQFVASGTYSFLNLEEHPDYKEYKGNNGAIMAIDTLIQQLSFIFGINAYVKRRNRTSLIKNIIDLSIVNNKVLTKMNYEERNNKIGNSYGFPREQSDFFVYQFTNSIFNLGTKANEFKDIHKDRKFNNEIIYCLIILVLNMDKNQVINFKTIQTCNYQEFKKSSLKLYQELKLLVGDQLKALINYPILSYIIYFISYQIAVRIGYYYRVNMPTSKQLTLSEKKHLVIKRILKICCTFIDIFNSIIESSMFVNQNPDQFSDKDKQVLQNFMIKYNSRLKDLFANHVLVQTMTKPKKEIIEFDNYSKEPVQIGNDNDDGNNDGNQRSLKHANLELKNWTSLQQDKIWVNLEDTAPQTININQKPTNKITCPNGDTHNLKFNPKTLLWECLKCGQSINSNTDTKADTKADKEINRNNKAIMNVAKYFCPNGHSHKWIFSNGKTCQLCGFKEGDQYKFDKKTLEQYYQSFFSVGKGVTLIQPEKVEEKTEIEKYQKLVKGFKATNQIEIFINSLKSISLENEIDLIDNIFSVYDHNKFINRKLILKTIDDKKVWEDPETQECYDSQTYQKLNEDLSINNKENPAIPFQFSLKNMIMQVFDPQNVEIIEAFCFNFVTIFKQIESQKVILPLAKRYQTLTFNNSSKNILEEFAISWNSYLSGFNNNKEMDKMVDWIFKEINDLIKENLTFVNLIVAIIKYQFDYSFSNKIYWFQDLNYLKIYNKLFYAEIDISEPSYYTNTEIIDNSEAVQDQDHTEGGDDNIEDVDDGYDLYDQDNEEADPVID